MRSVFACLPASGQGAKLMNEVYDSTTLVKEEKWSEKFKITLLKTRYQLPAQNVKTLGSY